MALQKPVGLVSPILFFFLYYLQGILYPSGSILSQVSIFFFLLIGLYYYGKTALYVHKPFWVTIWLIFYLVQTASFLFSPQVVFGMVYEAIGEVHTMDQFKSISAFMLSFCIGYVVARKSGKISNNILVSIGLIFFLLALIRYFYMLHALLSWLRVDGVTNNSGYFVVGILPFLPFFLKRSKILAAIILVLSIVLIMFAAKRGAIVCMVAALFFSVLFYLKENKASMKAILLAVVLFLGAGYLIYYAYESNEWLLSRIEFMQNEGIGGRGVAYPVLLGHWYNDTNFWTLMFGNGMAQTVTVWGNFAHNDWLELLICNGVVGVVLYLMIFVGLFRFIYRSSLSSWVRLSAYLCMLIWFLQSLFSMGFTSMSNVEYILLLGLIVGSEKVQFKKVPCNG